MGTARNAKPYLVIQGYEAREDGVYLTYGVHHAGHKLNDGKVWLSRTDLRDLLAKCAALEDQVLPW